MAGSQKWLAVVAICTNAASQATAQVAARTECVSTAASSTLGDAASGAMQRLYCGSLGCLYTTRDTVPAISPDGRYVAFVSDASNLIAPPPPQGIAQVYRKDRESGQIELVSTTPSGAPGNADSGFSPIVTTEGEALSISADGRFVAFVSEATDLVPGDVSVFSDVFVRDMASGIVERISESINTGAANSDSFGPRITPDGRYVAFYSSATNLIANDGNNYSDTFVFDRVLGVMERVSTSSSGQPANAASFDASISADGRYVAFLCTATNLDGPLPNGNMNVFVKDRVAGTVIRASRTPSGSAINKSAYWPRLSADGNFVAFQSGATNLVSPADPNLQNEIFLYQRGAPNAVRMSFASFGVPGPATAWSPTLSADGRFLAYYSASAALVPGDVNLRADVFVLDRQTGTLAIASRDGAGVQGNDSSSLPMLSADGRCIAFNSTSTNFVANDTNLASDVFVRDRGFGGGVEAYCIAFPNSQGCVPQVGATGLASASAGSGFNVFAGGLLNQRAGLIFYGTAGPTLVSFGSTMMCVRPPRLRTAVQSSGGTPTPAVDCTGAFVLDFNAYVATGIDPALVAGAEVWLQAWSRDPGLASNTHLTQGLHFQLGP